MRRFRLICALVLAASLAVLPVAAGLAMAHAARAQSSMMASGGDCPCCKPAKTDGCFLVCCHLQALTVDGSAMAAFAPVRFVAPGEDAIEASAPKPDPPPPRC
jgi:hypothetical protein